MYFGGINKAAEEDKNFLLKHISSKSIINP